MRQESRHHTDEQIREAFAFALELVEELGVDEELRPALVVKAIELRVAKQITVEAVVPGLPLLDGRPRG